MIYAYSAVPLDNYDQCHRWLQQVRPLMAAALKRSGLDAQVKVQLTGRPVFVDEIASGMKSDMSTNAPGTLFMIGLLFWLVHREITALLLLLATLLVVMIWTALSGAALLAQLNVISIGFASILLGLAEDFAIVLHQEAKSHPHLSLAEVRRIAGPGIFWSAVTTASAFALLNLSSLPGLRQLGTLVALGILLGAWVMTWLFLPLLFRFRRRKPLAEESPHDSSDVHSRAGRFPAFARAATGFVLAGSAIILALHPTRLNPSPDVLRPRESEASRALALVQKNLGVEIEPYWLIVQAKTAGEAGNLLRDLEPTLKQNIAEGRISSYNLPLEIWPNPSVQKTNQPVLRHIANEKTTLIDAAVHDGFTRDGLSLTAGVLDEFAAWPPLAPGSVQWPRGRIADWLLPRFASETSSNVMALGLVYPTATFDPGKIIPPAISEHVLLSGWRLLGKEVFSEVKREIPLISLAVFVIVFAALFLTFRRWGDVLLSFAVLAASALILLATMALFGWEWNLINLTAVPLLLGMGIDYSIHIQLTMKRMNNNAVAVFHSVGRALLLAGSTSIIGFALLGTSSNLGMASLGKVCALGLTITLLVSVFLLPFWTKTKSTRSVKAT
jgi:predicted exporter